MRASPSSNRLGILDSPLGVPMYVSASNASTAQCGIRASSSYPLVVTSLANPSPGSSLGRGPTLELVGSHDRIALAPDVYWPTDSNC